MTPEHPWTLGAWAGVPGVEVVDDPDDARVDEFRDLRDAELRRRRGLFAVEGRRLVARLLAGRRFQVRALLVTPCALGAVLETRGARPAAPEPPGARAAALGGIPVLVAQHATIRRIVGFPFHRGAVALAERGPDLAPAALLAPDGPRLLVAIEDLADPENVGAVFRNAAAFGADAVLLSPAAADPLNRKAIRVSAGAALDLPFARPGAWPAGLARVRDAGFHLLALTPDPDAVDVADLGTLPPRLALIVGAEGSGLGPASRALAAARVRIAMAAGVDSLNAASATAIALHRLARVDRDARRG